MFSLGVDFGTNSVRALVVRCSDGAEFGSRVIDYPSGAQGVLLDPKDGLLARQHPGDYLYGLEESITGALAEAARKPDFDPSKVVGHRPRLRPARARSPSTPRTDRWRWSDKWKGDLNAQCWLWKDHTSWREAARITELCAKLRPQYIAKMRRGLFVRMVLGQALALPQRRSGNIRGRLLLGRARRLDAVRARRRGRPATGQAGSVRRRPQGALLRRLGRPAGQGVLDRARPAPRRPQGPALREGLRRHRAGWAALPRMGGEDSGLPAGIPIAIGEFDVHYGAIGCGVREGTLVKVIGTSTCDCAVVSADKQVADIPGICGIVKGAILPGFFGIEAGQSAVGDIFKWWVEVVLGRRRGASRRAHRRGGEAASRASRSSGPRLEQRQSNHSRRPAAHRPACSARTSIRRGRTSIAP